MSDASEHISAALRQFGCPHEQWDDSIFALVSFHAGRGKLTQFLNRYKSAIRVNSSGLSDILEFCLEDATALNAVGDPALGAIERAAQLGCNNPTVVAAGFALHCTGQPNMGGWQASFLAPERFRWKRWLLPPTREISVDYERSSAAVTLENADIAGRTVKLDAADGTANGGKSLPSVGSIVLLPRSQVPEDLKRGSERLSEFSVVDIEPIMVCSFEDALTLLMKYAPRYVDWVNRVIREIIVSPYKAQSSQSGSWRDALGTVQVSWSPDPISVAEALVHEASHQYAYHVYRVSSLDDGSDTNLYYSPAARRSRPLERILFAYHAFANVLLFYGEAMRATDNSSGDLSKRLLQCRDFVHELDEPLRDNKALTAAGRSLYETLRSRIAIDQQAVP